MHQPVHSLELSNLKLQELYDAGYNYCDEIKHLYDLKIPELPKTKSAFDIYQEECMSGHIITLYKKLDEVLGGGIFTERITELCGEPGSGKTQLCFQLCVNVQLPVYCGGLAGEALYISTNKGFASHRLFEIAKAVVDHYNNFKVTQSSAEDLNANLVMKKIYCINVDTHEELAEAIQYLKDWLQDHLNVRLIIIDSISAPFKILDGQERTVGIYNLFKDLQKLAQIYHFAIVVTNDFTTRIHSANLIYKVPSLGDSYYHRINTRIQLSKVSSNIFKAQVIKNVIKDVTSQEVEFSLFV